MLTGLNLKLAEAAKAVGAKLKPNQAALELVGVSTDSRTVKPGELFVALRGETFDGHQYVAQAFERGAAAAVIDRVAKTVSDKPCLTVSDTLRALGDLAAYIRRRQPLTVLAVTGTNGKTTTKEMILAIIGRRHRTLATKGNFNNLIGLPLTLFGLRPEHQAAILEMGMSVPGEIARLAEIADPDVGLVTNIGPGHMETLGSLDGVARAKGELFAGLPDRATAVVNADDWLVVREARNFNGRHLTFGFESEADVRVSNLRSRGLSGTSFDLVTPQGSVAVQFDLLGRHNVANALAAAAGALAMGASLEDIRAGLQDFRPFPGRLELKRVPGPMYILDDTYNSNPASAGAALKVLKGLGGRGRLVAVLGDMLELGRLSRSLHAAIGRTAAESGVDILVAVGSKSKALAQEAERAGLPADRISWFGSTGRAAKWLRDQARPHDRILIKGSRGMHMEQIVAAMTEGGDR